MNFTGLELMECSLIVRGRMGDRGGGGATKQVRFYPYETGGGCKKTFQAMFYGKTPQMQN